MAHEKCFAICENKCMVETMSKEQIENYSKPVISSDTELDVNGVLYLRLEPNISETVYNNTENPTKVYFSYDSRATSEYVKGTYQTCRFRFNKGMGTAAKPSSFIQAFDSTFHVKYLNDDLNISNFTKVFVEVLVEPGTLYVKVSGC